MFCSSINVHLQEGIKYTYVFMLACKINCDNKAKTEEATYKDRLAHAYISSHPALRMYLAYSVLILYKVSIGSRSYMTIIDTEGF